MEDFEQIKEISLKDAKKILPQNIAYLTLKTGEVIIVNGLDHDKFDKKEKDYEDFIEDQSRIKTNIEINIETPLQKIQEDTEENERNSNLCNQKNSFPNINYNNNNIQNPFFNNNRIIYPSNIAYGNQQQQMMKNNIGLQRHNYIGKSNYNNNNRKIFISDGSNRYVRYNNHNYVESSKYKK